MDRHAVAQQILAAVLDDIDLGDLLEREEFADLSFDEVQDAHHALLEGKVTITWD